MSDIILYQTGDIRVTGIKFARGTLDANFFHDFSLILFPIYPTRKRPFTRVTRTRVVLGLT
jgi:hypothetical protein